VSRVILALRIRAWQSSLLLTACGRDLKINGNQLGSQARNAFGKGIPGFALPALLSVLLTALSLLAEASAKEMAANESCTPKAGNRAIVTAVNDRLELTLADGRVLRIAGLEAVGPTPDDPYLGAQVRNWLAAWLENREILHEILDPRPDRWGRTGAIVFAARASGEVNLASVGESLVERGFARVVPDQSKNPCEKWLLEAEKAARAAERGLWSDPYYKVISATDAEAFTEHAGSFILAEGRVTEVRDGSARTMLFFGPHRRDHLAVTVLQRNVKIFEAAGLHFHRLIGQTLRIRGLLETHFGPEIEVTDPGDVELIAGSPSETAKPMQKGTGTTQP
jgi:endonuclease YncB( thermonuclease family)